LRVIFCQEGESGNRSGRLAETVENVANTDGSGRAVDFHALRHTFITRLARSGVVPAVNKSLARHSGIVLTRDHDNPGQMVWAGRKGAQEETEFLLSQTRTRNPAVDSRNRR